MAREEVVLVNLSCDLCGSSEDVREFSLADGVAGRWNIDMCKKCYAPILAAARDLIQPGSIEDLRRMVIDKGQQT